MNITEQEKKDFSDIKRKRNDNDNPNAKRYKIQSKPSIDRSGWAHWFPYDNPETLPDVLLDIVVTYDGRKFKESPEEFSKAHMFHINKKDSFIVCSNHHLRGIQHREYLDKALLNNELYVNDAFAYIALGNRGSVSPICEFHADHVEICTEELDIYARRCFYQYVETYNYPCVRMGKFRFD